MKLMKIPLKYFSGVVLKSVADAYFAWRPIIEIHNILPISCVINQLNDVESGYCWTSFCYHYQPESSETSKKDSFATKFNGF